MENTKSFVESSVGTSGYLQFQDIKYRFSLEEKYENGNKCKYEINTHQTRYSNDEAISICKISFSFSIIPISNSLPVEVQERGPEAVMEPLAVISRRHSPLTLQICLKVRAYKNHYSVVKAFLD